MATPQTKEMHAALARIFAELTTGADAKLAWVLNPGDPGLLASLDRLSAGQASNVKASGSSIAAHVDHLIYGLGLLMRWSQGEEPFQDANYAASWERRVVGDEEWRRLREELREAVSRWHRTLATPRELTAAELTGFVSSVVHLAYHVGAIRQMEPELRGPRATD